MNEHQIRPNGRSVVHNNFFQRLASVPRVQLGHQVALHGVEAEQQQEQQDKEDRDHGNQQGLANLPCLLCLTNQFPTLVKIKNS
jgi:hypothetical protein